MEQQTGSKLGKEYIKAVYCRLAYLTYMQSQFSSVQSPSHVWLFATPWTAAPQASLSITDSQSLLKFMSIESVIPSNHLILCHPLLLLHSIFSSIRVFSNELAFCIRWPKYWEFNFDIRIPNECSGIVYNNFNMWVDYICSLLLRIFTSIFTRIISYNFLFF